MPPAPDGAAPRAATPKARPGRRAAFAAETLSAAAEAFEVEIDRAFGPPDRRSWSRDELRRLPVPVIGAGLRRAAIGVAPEHADAFGQRQLLPVAERVVSEAREPKSYQWAGGVEVCVGPRRVELRRAEDHASAADRSTSPVSSE